MVASDSASCCGPHPNIQSPPPMAQVPSPIGVSDKSELPRVRDSTLPSRAIRSPQGGALASDSVNRCGPKGCGGAAAARSAVIAGRCRTGCRTLGARRPVGTNSRRSERAVRCRGAPSSTAASCASCRAWRRRRRSADEPVRLLQARGGCARARHPRAWSSGRTHRHRRRFRLRCFSSDSGTSSVGAARQDDGALDEVLELADVARPVIARRARPSCPPESSRSACSSAARTSA